MQISNPTNLRYLCVFFRERFSPLPNVTALGEAIAGPRSAASKRQRPRPRRSRARVRSLSCFARTPSGTDRAPTIATLELLPSEGAPSRDYAQAVDTIDGSGRSSQQEVAEATPRQASVGVEVLLGKVLIPSFSTDSAGVKRFASGFYPNRRGRK